MLANDPSPNPKQPFAARNGTGAPRQALIDPLLGKPPKDKLDGGEADDGGQGFREVLKALGEMPIASEPEKVRATTLLGQQPKQRRHIASLRRALTLGPEGLRAAADRAKRSGVKILV